MHAEAGAASVTPTRMKAGERFPSGRGLGALLLGLGLLHWSVIAADATGSGDSLLAVAGFVALELVLLVPLLPLAVAQARAVRSARGALWLHAPLLLLAAAAVVVLYRGTVLSVALLVELGAVPLDQLGAWWSHVGPWQLQADLLIYAGLGSLLAVREGSTTPRPDAAPSGEPTGDPVERITVPVGGSVRVLPVDRIRWIEGAGTYVRIHSDSGSHLRRDTLRDLEERLAPAGFVRVHRSAVVNVRWVERLEPTSRGAWIAHLGDGTEVRVAASRTDGLEAALGDTLGG